MLRDLLDTILRLIFGHNTTDNAKDWYQSHTKANASRAEVDAIIAESELKNKKEK
jgi:hypothetical protein